MKDKNLLRPAEAGEYLGVCTSQIWNYAKAGLITPIKLSPRVTTFRKEDLDRFIDEAMKKGSNDVN